MKEYRCLCCGYRTIGKRGDFEICPICFWEDEPYIILGEPDKKDNITSVFYHNDCEKDSYDGSDVLDIESGANHMLTLRQGRKNFRQFGACEIRFKGYTRFPHSSEMNKWRKENRIVDHELVFLMEKEG